MHAGLRHSWWRHSWRRHSGLLGPWRRHSRLRHTGLGHSGLHEVHEGLLVVHLLDGIQIDRGVEQIIERADSGHVGARILREAVLLVLLRPRRGAQNPVDFGLRVLLLLLRAVDRHVAHSGVVLRVRAVHVQARAGLALDVLHDGAARADHEADFVGGNQQADGRRVAVLGNQLALEMEEEPKGDVGDEQDLALGFEDVLGIAGDDDIAKIGVLGVAFFGDVDRGAGAALQLGNRGALVPDDEPDEALLDGDGLEALAAHLHLVDDVGTAGADHLFDHLLGLLDGFGRAADRHIANHARRIHIRVALNLPASDSSPYSLTRIVTE